MKVSPKRTYFRGGGSVGTYGGIRGHFLEIRCLTVIYSPSAIACVITL